jgi:hypothetical protein
VFCTEIYNTSGFVQKLFVPRQNFSEVMCVESGFVQKIFVLRQNFSNGMCVESGFVQKFC